jgi:hypothetical protein
MHSWGRNPRRRGRSGMPLLHGAIRRPVMNAAERAGFGDPPQAQVTGGYGADLAGTRRSNASIVSSAGVSGSAR